MKTINAIFTLLFMMIVKFGFSQGTWTQKTSLPGPARIEAASFELNGKGYVLCGRDPGTQTYYNDVWEYDPSNNSWTQKANFPGAGRREPVAYAMNNKGYIGTGRDLSGAFNDWWEYNPTNDSWTQLANFPAGGRRDAMGMSIGNKCYLGCGQTVSGFTLTAQTDWWEYDRTTNAWTQKVDVPGPARGAAQAIAYGTKGYVGMGRVSTGSTNDWWEYDPATNTWTQKANFGAGNRDESCAFVVGTRIYVGSGHFNATNMADWWSYDPIGDTWTQVASLAAGRFEASAFIINGKGYVAAGYTTILDAELWEFTPPVIPATINSTQVANQFTTVVGTPSSNQTITVSGSNLTANISITAPTNFEISLSSGSGFGSSLNLTPSSGVVNSTTIYVRYNPASAGTHSGNIAVSSTGVTSQNVAVSGISTNPSSPNFTANSSFTTFNTVVGTPSANQTMTVSGNNLTGNIVLNAPTNFEISTISTSGFSSSLNLSQTAGTVSATTIYVRYNPSSSGTHSGNLSLTSNGATSQNIALNGISTATSLEEISETYKLTFYPNPMTSKTTIEIRNINGLKKDLVHLKMYSFDGKTLDFDFDQMKTEMYGAIGFTLNRENFSAGIYIFEIISENKMIAKGKIVVE